MEKTMKKLHRRMAAVLVMAVFAMQSVLMPHGTLHLLAAEPSSQETGLMTAYEPQLTQVTSETSGLRHPGVGLTTELLDNVQQQVRDGAEPWKMYFEDMLLSSAASKTPSIKLTDPTGQRFDSQGFNSKFISDGLTAYTQAILYYVTGDNAYRKNAVTILRNWGGLDPDEYAYFSDAHIHTGIPMNRMCIAAEIIRYSSYQVTEGYTEEDLNWTLQQIQDFSDHLVRPVIETFQSSPDHFMNQHLYTVIGAMSGYLFLDDAQGYAKTVEWFTVNKDAADQGFNGSIKRLFREITTVDEVGEKEGSGTPLDEPVIQHVEMGRDQAHGCGDLTNAAILARLMLGQDTQVDPVDGTVSTEADAVGIYEFLDDRILEAADFFFQYMLGYDAQWVPVPFAMEEDGTIKDMYTAFSSSYRGRYQTINFWDLYSYYTYERSDVDLETDYPYFYEGFMKKMPSNYYWNGNLGINWDNKDGGGDFWLFLPKEAEGDANLLAQPQTDYRVEAEDRGSMVQNAQAMSVQQEGNTEYIRFQNSGQESRLAITSGGTGDTTIAFVIRTDGIAKLSLDGGVSGSIYLPDTDGQWQYVMFQRGDTEGFGDLYYICISDMEGTYVDLDAIDIKPSQVNDARTIHLVTFESGREDYHLVTYAGAPFAMEFGAVTSGEGTVTHSGINLPQGASVDAETGMVSWTPTAQGTYTFYVSAAAGNSQALKKIMITVASSRQAAIDLAAADYEEEAVYVSASEEAFLAALQTAEAMKDTASDEAFSAQLNVLCEKAAQLSLVSPLLADDPLTAGDSLDYPGLVFATNMGGEIHNLTDGDSGSFCGYYLAVDKAHILDFGPDFKISATKFGYQSRLGFSDRLAGVQVFGSNDNKNWTRLTVGEASFTQAFHTVDVQEQYQNEKYRYLMIKKTTEYPDVLSGSKNNLLEFGEFRIWGTRYEVGNKIDSISMSSADSVSGRIRMGDTVTLAIQAREPISQVTANIQGQQVNAVEQENNLWIAQAQIPSGSPTGDIQVTVDYQRQDGTAGDTMYGTTDGSALFLVNSDIYIDTALVAESITATSGSWDGNLTPQQCAAQLFDGDVTTFGDLEHTWDDYYIVDFGEGVAVSLEEVMLMPRSTASNHASRLNGTILSGSNNGTDWIPITAPVTGAAMNQWSHIQGDQILNSGAYRYIKISGAEQGDIAEVELYGTYQAAPSVVAGKITSMDVQQAGQGTLKYPQVPGGYTVSVKESSHPQVVGLDGSIYTPQEDTTVTLTLTVTRNATGEWADTAPMAVLVKGMASLVSDIQLPQPGDTVLELPQVPEGYELTITESSRPELISLQGVITAPQKHALVDITLKLSRASDGAEVILPSQRILLYGQDKNTPVSLDQADIVASNDPWDAAYTKETIGALLVDGDIATWGDLKGNGSYTIDLGEGASAILDQIRFYPRNTKADHIDRLNGTYVMGSADGVDWVTITHPVEGATDAWYIIPAEEFETYGQFRYFRIVGGTGGNIAEVEFYGSFTQEPVEAKVTEVSLSSPQDDHGRIKVGDTVILTIRSKGQVSDVTALIQGQQVSAVKQEEGLWTAQLVIPQNCESGVMEVSVNYKKDDETAAEPITGTTDQSSLILTDPSGWIDPAWAVDKTATSGSWDGTLTPQQCAEQLFDGNIATFGDLKNTYGDYYILDFGSSKKVSIQEVLLMPRSTRQDHADRMNGTILSGSNDGETWTQLTVPSQGAVMNRWTYVGGEEILDQGYYRYIKISGAQQGNIAEVEWYGSFQDQTQ